MTMIRWVRKLVRDTRGGTAIEYGLIAAVIVIVMLVSLILTARTTVDIWGNVSSKVVAAGS